MNIFVAKLNFSTQDDGLRDAFEQFGEVDSAKIIMDRETGRSKGFGFVEMPNDDEAMDAIESLNETELDGRTIVVKKSSSPQRRRWWRTRWIPSTLQRPILII
jgi:RNA recognition motif-containing protein